MSSLNTCVNQISEMQEFIPEGENKNTPLPKSRCVSIFLIKYKCLLLLTIIILTILQYVYTIAKEWLRNEELTLKTLDLFSKRNNVSVND